MKYYVPENLRQSSFSKWKVNMENAPFFWNFFERIEMVTFLKFLFT